jgi:hypothetical protein
MTQETARRIADLAPSIAGRLDQFLIEMQKRETEDDMSASGAPSDR